MNNQIHTDYTARINAVFDFIEKNLDRDIKGPI